MKIIFCQWLPEVRTHEDHHMLFPPWDGLANLCPNLLKLMIVSEFLCIHFKAFNNWVAHSIELRLDDLATEEYQISLPWKMLWLL